MEHCLMRLILWLQFCGSQLVETSLASPASIIIFQFLKGKAWKFWMKIWIRFYNELRPILQQLVSLKGELSSCKKKFFPHFSCFHKKSCHSLFLNEENLSRNMYTLFDNHQDRISATRFLAYEIVISLTIWRPVLVRLIMLNGSHPPVLSVSCRRACNYTKYTFIHSFCFFVTLQFYSDFVWPDLGVDIESFWTEGYASQIPNSGHELAIMLVKLHTKCIFQDFFCV